MWADALTTTEKCIAIYYLSPACHHIRWKALSGLNRIEDGAQEILVARSVSTKILDKQPNASGNGIYAMWLTQAMKDAQTVLDETAPENESPK